MIHYFLDLHIVSSSWILLFCLSRRLLHSCLWEQQHLLLIPAFNPSNLPTVHWFTSYIPFSAFQSSSPTFSFNSYPSCFPILCKEQKHNFPASSTLILIPVFCSAAWKAPCPCSVCNNSLQAAPGLSLPANFLNGLQPLSSWFYKHLEVLKWVQFLSAWMA